MIVFRCVSERELANMVGIANPLNAPRGQNTFKYEKDINYKHFFYFYDSAIFFMNAQNNDRYYNKYSLIMAYDIPNEILSDHFGLGTYRVSCVSELLKDYILSYFDIIYFPEFAIPEILIKKDMIVGIGSQKRITPISYISYDKMENIITNSQKDFLNYEKWLFENGTNVFKEILLEDWKVLFPFGENEKNL